jgi:hypothetical protein
LACGVHDTVGEHVAFCLVELSYILNIVVCPQEIFIYGFVSFCMGCQVGFCGVPCVWSSAGC